MANTKPEPKEFSYTVPAVDFMDEQWDRFYDLWQEIVKRRAENERRMVADIDDVKATLAEAAERLIAENENGAIEK